MSKALKIPKEIRVPAYSLCVWYRFIQNLKNPPPKQTGASISVKVPDPLFESLRLACDHLREGREFEAYQEIARIRLQLLADTPQAYRDLITVPPFPEYTSISTISAPAPAPAISA